MLPLLGWVYCRIDVRQHPGSRAYHRAGGCPDGLAHLGQILSYVGVGLRLVLAGLALAEAVAVAVHFKDVDVMGEAVEQRAGQAF